ncbi:MAG: hypothetical protein Kow0069_10610 [Promethearchaeota archaeon]
MSPPLVRVRTPSRLHFSLVDLNGSLGRIDGGVGVALEKPNVVIEAEKLPGEPDPPVEAPKEWVEPVLLVRSFLAESDPSLVEGVQFRLKECYPAHVGLGSKTQLSLAMAYAACALSGKVNLLRPETLAWMVHRGGTSGIGYRAFFEGGFLLDGGHEFGPGKDKETFLPSSASNASPAVPLARFPVPEEWRFVLALPKDLTGAHDSGEVDIFQECCPVPVDEVRRLCHLLLVQTLPAVATGNLEAFGSSINAMQQVGFKKLELELQPPRVRELASVMRSSGAAGVGMSSFGPVVYAVVGNDRAAEEVAESAVAAFEEGSVEITVTRANNRGAELFTSRGDAGAGEGNWSGPLPASRPAAVVDSLLRDEHAVETDPAFEYFDPALGDAARAAFEAGIKLGALYHLSSGFPAPTDERALAKLESGFEAAIGAQPFVEDVRVRIDRERLSDGADNPFGYGEISGRVLDARVKVRYRSCVVVARFRFVDELKYPLMYVESILKN